MMVIGMCRALYRDKDWTFWRATSSRPRNYVFAENASLITSGTNEKNVIYYSFSYENWNPKYRRHIHNVIVNEMQKFSCLKFNQQTDRERMPPAPALSPVIRLRRLRTRDRCHAKLEDRAMNVYLHEQWCFTPYKIITAFLEALGMHAEKLERPDNVIYQTATLDAIVNHIDPRPEFHHVYATMPRNYEQIYYKMRML
uniref:Peptidase M12A domain-containing protein n=1 Tax=Romanomermis culicivorax TaxID=13658 RepID=A0A915K4N0_ROMCU